MGADGAEEALENLGQLVPEVESVRAARAGFTYLNP